MLIGRRFRIKAVDKQSLDCFYTWSAAQMLIYNALVQEREYFWGFYCKFGGQIPPIDSKYSHLIDKTNQNNEWLCSIPCQVFRNGATLHKAAWSRCFAGLARKPHRKKIKEADRSLWLTRELFTIRQVSKNWYELTVGTKTIKGGTFRFKAHRPFTMPASIHLKSKGSDLYISFACEIEDEHFPETEAEQIERLRQYSKEELLERTVGIDRGVVIPFQLSNGKRYDYTQTQKDRIASYERRVKHYQRMMERRNKGSENWKKAKSKVRKCMQCISRIREDFAHKTSHAIVNDKQTEIIGVEDLKVKSMTARPKPKVSENGKYLPNGAKAKAGLNKAILGNKWGQTIEFVRYKARRAGKVVVEVPSAYTSQTCGRCDRQDNTSRKSQSLFRCANCGFMQNADINASEVIRKRAVKELMSGKLKPKEVKKTMRFRRKQACAEPRQELPRQRKLARACGGDSQSCSSTLGKTHERPLKQEERCCLINRSPVLLVRGEFTARLSTKRTERTARSPNGIGSGRAGTSFRRISSPQ